MAFICFLNKQDIHRLFTFLGLNMVRLSLTFLQHSQEALHQIKLVIVSYVFLKRHFKEEKGLEKIHTSFSGTPGGQMSLRFRNSEYTKVMCIYYVTSPAESVIKHMKILFIYLFKTHEDFNRDVISLKSVQILLPNVFVPNFLKRTEAYFFREF